MPLNTVFHSDGGYASSCPRCGATMQLPPSNARKIGGIVGGIAGAVYGATQAVREEPGSTLGTLAAVTLGSLAGGAAGCMSGIAFGRTLEASQTSIAHCPDCGFRN